MKLAFPICSVTYLIKTRTVFTITHTQRKFTRIIVDNVYFLNTCNKMSPDGVNTG